MGAFGEVLADDGAQRGGNFLRGGRKLVKRIFKCFEWHSMLNQLISRRCLSEPRCS